MGNYSKKHPQKLALSEFLNDNECPVKASLQQDKQCLDGQSVLDDVFNFTGRFIAYPSKNTHIAHVLWIAHTHLMEIWSSTPRLAVLSPAKECGKTRVLEVTEALVPRPIMAVNVTSAYLIRKIGATEGLPTVLFDEIDTVFGKNARHNEDIRALINAGYRRGMGSGRVAKKGDLFTTEEISAYCAFALAGIGIDTLPDTVLSRSIILSMRRRTANEIVEPWRERTCSEEGNEIRDRLTRWASSVKDGLRDNWPEMPQGVEDRSADVWEPIISVAKAAGCRWSEQAHVACVALVTESRGKAENQSIRLLKDLRSIFGSQPKMFTADILSSLARLEDAPWSKDDFTAYRLAKLLRTYGISSKDIRIGDNTRKGYIRGDLSDAWDRYLPLLLENPQHQQHPQQIGRANDVYHM